MWDTKMILEEGNGPHLPSCNIFLPWAALNHRHPTTALCMQDADRTMRRLVEEEAWVGTAMAFQEYGSPLETVTSFKYLGSFLTATYNALQAFIANL